MKKPNELTFQVTGMHCGSCVAKVEATLQPYGENVKVTLNPPRAVITNSASTINELNQQLSLVGSYQLSNLSTSRPNAEESVTQAGWINTYKPLLMIIGYILLTCILIQIAQGAFSSHGFMTNFMAGFFLVFSFFKLLNLREFANSYAMYDLLAIRWNFYGLIYPFIELGLGIAYVIGWQENLTNLATLVVMGFSSIGVIRAVLNKQKIRCACLGSVFNLPMSTITIIEDLLMAAMALWMLFK
ncbi:MAG: heavy-metal-associated domain-containing protein [Methylophilaceae bacterium]|nr:MauE/DoxX family redox-associated membrane protein [Methyloradius sp.]